MSEIKLHKRVKYAGDVHAELLKLGWDCETAALFCDNIPDADAVEVVRCKDCVNYNTSCCADGFGWCEELNRGMMDDKYCSFGKLRSHHGTESD